MDIYTYIKPELLVLIPVLYIMGIALKKSRFADCYIPIILGSVGILLAGLWIIGTSHFQTAKEYIVGIFMAITQGVLIAGASVYINQIVIQSGKK